MGGGTPLLYDSASSFICVVLNWYGRLSLGENLGGETRTPSANVVGVVGSEFSALMTALAVGEEATGFVFASGNEVGEDRYESTE